MSHVSRGGHYAFGKSRSGARLRFYADRRMVEIHVAGWYAGLYR